MVAEVEEGFEEGIEAGFVFRTEAAGTGWKAMALKELQVVVEC